jgi:hypothetical protein
MRKGIAIPTAAKTMWKLRETAIWERAEVKSLIMMLPLSPDGMRNDYREREAFLSRLPLEKGT